MNIMFHEKFHEYISYGLGVMSRTLRKYYTTLILGKGVNLKTELARVVFLVPDTSSRNDLAICEVS